MSDDLMKFDLPQVQPAKIKVVGVGGGGGNAVNHMFEQGINDVDFILCNTDAQALSKSMVPIKIQIGEAKTKGRGAGNNPEVGRESAMENLDEVIEVLADNTQMVFITAGMGGGTGTGAAPIIAKASKDLGILTVAIVTVPFRFEGKKRIQHAIEGIEALREHVDSLLIINNEKLREMYGNLTLSDAFKRADDVLAIAAKGIAEIITVHGKVNVDFADVSTVMANSGVSIMGSATASGEDRAVKAIEQAIKSPLLNSTDIKGAKDILLNITSGTQEVTMDEIAEITDFILDEAGADVNMIWGSVVNPNLTDELNVTIIATGFEMDTMPEFSQNKPVKQTHVMLHEPEAPKKPQPSITQFDEDFEPNPKPNVRKQDVDTSVFSLEMDVLDEFNIVDGNPKQASLSFDDDDMFEVKEKAAPVEQNRSKFVQPEVQRKVVADPNKAFRYQEVKEMDDISSFENIPAYKRKNMNMDNIAPQQIEQSRITMSEGKNGPRFRENNSFLHDNVD